MMPPRRLPNRHASQGFTLIEAVVVIVVFGVLAGIVGSFLRVPVFAYLDAARRAELTDIADTAVRRMARDFRLALPNSVRNPDDGSDQCLEFMPTKVGGRYRSEVDAVGDGDALDFTTADGGFDLLWTNSALPLASRIAAGDVVVVYNDGSATGNAYQGTNAIQVAAVAEPGGTVGSTAISFVDAATAAPFNRKQLPAESPARRFQVVPAGEHVVTYVCSNGRLYRLTQTLTAAHARPATCPAPPAGTPILADHVSQCSLVYEGATGVPSPGSLGSSGIVSMTLSVSREGESVRLYQQANINNQP